MSNRGNDAPSVREISLVQYAQTPTGAAVQLHILGQKKAVAILEKIHPNYRTLILGVIAGICVGNPCLLQEFLLRCGTAYSYQQSYNMFRFLKRLTAKIIDKHGTLIFSCS